MTKQQEILTLLEILKPHLIKNDAFESLINEVQNGSYLRNGSHESQLRLLIENIILLKQRL